jgi:hypothetical protein
MYLRASDLKACLTAMPARRMTDHLSGDGLGKPLPAARHRTDLRTRLFSLHV